jgi:hypothetical protein
MGTLNVGLFDLGRPFAAKRDHSLHGANGSTLGSRVHLLVKSRLNEGQQHLQLTFLFVYLPLDLFKLFAQTLILFLQFIDASL